MQREKKDEIKQEYEKPKLRSIELTAEEVLGVGCKTRFSDPAGVSGQGCLSGGCQQSLGS